MFNAPIFSIAGRSLADRFRGPFINTIVIIVDRNKTTIFHDHWPIGFINRFNRHCFVDHSWPIVDKSASFTVAGLSVLTIPVSRPLADHKPTINFPIVGRSSLTINVVLSF